MVDVLVFGETRGEALDSTTAELLGAARDLGGEVGVTLMGRIAVRLRGGGRRARRRPRLPSGRPAAGRRVR